MGCNCSKPSARKELLTLKSTNALYNSSAPHQRAETEKEKTARTGTPPTLQEMASVYQSIHKCIDTAAVKNFLAAYPARGLLLLMAADAPMHVTRGAYNTLWDEYRKITDNWNAPQTNWPLANSLAFFSSYIARKCANGVDSANGADSANGIGRADITAITNLRVGSNHFTYLRSSADNATHDFTYSNQISIVRVTAATGDYERFD